jgi:hypothetical protein
MDVSGPSTDSVATTTVWGSFGALDRMPMKMVARSLYNLCVARESGSAHACSSAALPTLLILSV